MLTSQINIPLFRLKTVTSKSLSLCQYRYAKKIDTVAKRGSMLEDWVTNKDKRKNWHFSIISDKPRANVFTKVHKPHRRRAALNSLFIRNITDVLSTGEIMQEISKYSIEITGVSVSPCFNILNVYWQVPTSKYDSCEDIGKLLERAAPKIRAELISRNVVGRVPFLFFLRDSTNAMVSEFEKAMKELESQPKTESGVVIDEAFIDDLYKFKDSKPTDAIKVAEPSVKQKMKKEEELNIPKPPYGMKCDVFGLDHNEIIQKLIALKGKTRSAPEKTAVITPKDFENEDDLFSKIPGMRFKGESPLESSVPRAAIFKKFHIERKMLMEEKRKMYREGASKCEEDYDDDDGTESYSFDDDTEIYSFDDDFIEDETEDGKNY